MIGGSKNRDLQFLWNRRRVRVITVPPACLARTGPIPAYAARSTASCVRPGTNPGSAASNRDVAYFRTSAPSGAA